MPNSIDFYKGIFLHVIPVRIIVPWLNQLNKIAVIAVLQLLSTPRFINGTCNKNLLNVMSYCCPDLAIYGLFTLK